MARWRRTILGRTWRRSKWRLARSVARPAARALARVPAGVKARCRTASPWAMAVALNLGLAALILSLTFDPPLRGIPDALSAVTVYVVRETPEPPETPTPEEEVAEDPEVEIAAAEASPEDEPAEEVAPLAEAPAPAPAAALPETADLSVPAVALPDTDQGLGTPDGLVALSCYEQFSDPDKAAECAGREILSGWQGEVADLGGDWVKVAREMRRGARLPRYGPDPYGDLADNESIYQPQDPRFQSKEFLELGRYREAFDSEAEYRKFLSTYDNRSYISMSNPALADHGTPISEPLSGWRPSWMLREDPVIDRKAMEEIARIAREAEGGE